MFEWINPSFFQFFAFNIVFFLTVFTFALVLRVLSLAFASVGDKTMTTISVGIALFSVVFVFASKIFAIAVNAYSIYLMFNQDREMNFWFWALAVLYMIAVLNWFRAPNSVEVKVKAD